MVKDREISLLAIKTAEIIKEDRENELKTAQEEYDNTLYTHRQLVMARLQSAERRFTMTKTLQNRWGIKLLG